MDWINLASIICREFIARTLLHAVGNKNFLGYDATCNSQFLLTFQRNVLPQYQHPRISRTLFGFLESLVPKGRSNKLLQNTCTPIYQMAWHHIPENFDSSKTLLQEPQISHKLKVWKKGLKNILKNLHPPIHMQLQIGITLYDRIPPSKIFRFQFLGNTMWYFWGTNKI